jgi:hypothetical protein
MNFSFALLAILCALSLFGTVCAVLIAVRRTASPLAGLRSLASKVSSIEARLEETQESLSVLANRVKMQRVRTAALHVSDPPSADDPVNIKDALRKRAGLTAGKPAKHA